MYNIKHCKLLGIILFFTSTITPFPGIPVTFEKPFSVTPWYGIFELFLSGGATERGFDRCGTITNFLGIHGTENLKFLTAGVPQEILDKNPTSILNTLPTQQTGERFAELCWSGRLEEAQLACFWAQNLVKGFYIELFVPINAGTISDITWKDLSTQANSGSVDFAEWQNFMNNFKKNMAVYGVNVNSKDTSIGLGDIEFQIGWGHRWENVWRCCFFQFSAQCGIFLYGSNTFNYKKLFEVIRGDDHFGRYPAAIDVYLRATRWLGIGGQVAVIIPRNSTRNLGMQTDSRQNGYIKLARGSAHVDARNYIELFGYLDLVSGSTLDPFSTSLNIGYSVERFSRFTLEPTNQTVFNSSIVNQDDRFKSAWVHRIHFIMRLNFPPNKGYMPNVWFQYNTPISGKRHNKQSLVRGGTGISTVWNF